MEDDSYKRLSGGSYTTAHKSRMLLSHKTSSSILMSKRQKRKLSSISSSYDSKYLVAKKQGKNSYQMTNAQKMEIINQ